MLTFTKALGELLTPPGILIVFAIIGLLMQLRWRHFGFLLTTVSVLLLLVFSLPVTGYFLMNLLEESVPAITADENLRQRADAIVVLGGGRDANAPEYGGDTVSEQTLARLRYGTHLHRASGLPLLVTGGSVSGETIAEGELMRQVLADDFHTPVKWTETRSRTTYENAIYTRAILEAAGIHRIILVTHAWHMPRAAWAFRQTGLEVVPAAMSYDLGNSLAGLNLVPSREGFSLSSLALHEWVGMLWYRLAFRSPAPVHSFLTAPQSIGSG